MYQAIRERSLIFLKHKMKNLNQDELGIFVSASVFTAFASIEVDVESLKPIEIEISKHGDKGIKVVCHVDCNSLQEWYFFVTEKPEKVIKEVLNLVEEIDNHSNRWYDDYLDNVRIDIEEHRQTGCY